MKLPTYRSFVALELPGEAKSFARRAIDSLRPAGADVKWVEPAHLHLTLQFLGNITDEQAKAAEAALRRACADEPPLKLILSGLGAFPDTRRPKVIWVGLDGETERLGRLADVLAVSMAACGIERETRSFVPHLTLGRVRSGKNLEALAAALSESPPPLSFRARDVGLFHSTLTPTGPIHTLRAGVAFSERPDFQR